MNDHEREQWVNNHKFLFYMFQRYKGGMRKFIRGHRKEIDQAIQSELDRSLLRQAERQQRGL